MSEKSRPKLDPKSLKLLEDAMSAFQAGVEEYRQGVEDGTIEDLHDVEHVDLEKQDDHLKPLVGPKKK